VTIKRNTLEIKKNKDNAGLDKNGFEILFRTHFKGLTFFALEYVKDYEAAREIVQEVFVNVWEKRKSVDLEKSPKSYLSTSVRNRCLNYLRDRKKYSPDILEMESIGSDEEYIELDELIGDELKNKIDKATGELPDKCREIFLLSRIENKKYKEIADELNISVKTVEAQMSKALKLMREKLADFIN
jgi:RNA polymerase sigma-70 factor (ECF subfamily)